MEAGRQWKGCWASTCNGKWIPPDMEANAQHHKNGVSSLPHQKQESQTLAKSQPQTETLPFCSKPKYFGVTLDRSLTYRRYLESLRKKLSTGIALFWQHAGSGWGAGAPTLRITALALVHLTAEYCVPRSCLVPQCLHIRLIDLAINDALQIVTGRLRSTPTDKSYNLTEIFPLDMYV